MDGMDAPLAVIPAWLDATAIALGAGSAAVVAEQFRSKRLDWLGVAIIGTSAALGGGIIRDLLIGVRPVAMTNEWYLLTAAVASILGMLLQTLLARRDSIVTLLDALALGFFCAVGTAKAVEAGLPVLPSIFVGTCTAAGGGMIRDVLVGMPVGALYAGSLYAFAAMGGSAAYVGAFSLGLDPIWSMVICGVVTFLIRMASVWFGLSLPEQIALQWPRRGRGGEPAGKVTEEQFVDAAQLHGPDTRPVDLIAIAEEQRARRERDGAEA